MRANNNIIVCRASDLTAAWAQSILAPKHPDVVISGVDIISVDVGTTSRVRIAVDHDGPEALPRRWFVKIPSLSRRARLITYLPGLLNREIRFYKEVSHAIPLNLPTVLAAQSKPMMGSTLVLADITENGSQAGTPADTVTATQASLVVEQLARFHARFWNHANLEKSHRWLASPIRRIEDHLGTVLAVPLMKRGISRAGHVIPKALHLPALRYAQNRRRIMHFLASAPQTLVHYDCHPGNIFWNNAKPGFLDWQLVRKGEGIGDIAYFLATALDPHQRRAHEMHLLAEYKNILTSHGIEGLSAAKLFQRYRAHLTYPFEAMVLTLAIGGMMDIQSNLELIRRAAAAAEDHDAFAHLAV